MTNRPTFHDADGEILVDCLNNLDARSDEINVGNVVKYHLAGRAAAERALARIVRRNWIELHADGRATLAVPRSYLLYALDSSDDDGQAAAERRAGL